MLVVITYASAIMCTIIAAMLITLFLMRVWENKLVDEDLGYKLMTTLLVALIVFLVTLGMSASVYENIKETKCEIVKE